MPEIFIHRAPQERKKQKPPLPVKWNQTPKPDDFDAARSFLGLMMTDDLADAAITALRQAPVTQVKAKDVLRASKSGVRADAADLPGVQIELDKIENGESMNPVLLLQGSRSLKLDLVIADGFHRTHAAYANDDDAVIPAVVAKGLVSDDDAR